MTKKNKPSEKEHHVLTVRMDLADFRHLKLAQAKLQKQARRKVPYTEIIVTQIRGLPA